MTTTLGRKLPAQTRPISAHFSSEHPAADEAPFLSLPEHTLPARLSTLNDQVGFQCSPSVRFLRLEGSKHEAQALVEIPTVHLGQGRCKSISHKQHVSTTTNAPSLLSVIL